MPGSQLLLNLNTAEMHVREFRPDFRQPHLPRRYFVAERATELFEPGRLFALIGRALIAGYLSDQIHGGEHRDASFEALASLATLLSESKLSVTTRDMAALAAMRIKNVLGDFALALTGGCHPVKCGHIFLPR
jgi:hypothetical protein